MHTKKIRMIMRVLKYRRSYRRHVTRRYVEKGEVIANDSRLRREIRRWEYRKLNGFQDYVDVGPFSSFSFSTASAEFFLIAETAESLIRTDNKKDDELSSEDDGTYGAARALAASRTQTRETLLGNECVTSPLESASTFAYRCPVLPLPLSLSRRCGIFFSSFWAHLPSS